jgi:hypothetical protein
VLFQSRTRTVGLGEYPTYALRAGTWSRLWTSACGCASASFEPTGRSLWIDWLYRLRCVIGPPTARAVGDIGWCTPRRRRR